MNIEEQADRQIDTLALLSPIKVVCSGNRFCLSCSSIHTYTQPSVVTPSTLTLTILCPAIFILTVVFYTSTEELTLSFPWRQQPFFAY